ncbi:hypothetical protein FKG94_13675 [Exilibacterium tricleocarpae]|uniref:TrfB transcriptional repressor protein domain-containing protein n=1 Tax=Exilibacterium tricleocarpae TaxID=2591008 RepID=A0A545TLL4_9GAMM|nr:TrfB-related DNA-binding protein [Exilibacterium tricleocarpae]TQV78123.1 hypothetical protein FKG94_13675 [Exilibacterium tricleocarpae]
MTENYIWECKGPKGTLESMVTETLKPTNQEDKLKLTTHQFDIAVVEMPRLSEKMREAMWRVVVNGDSQREVAVSMDLYQNHLNTNINNLRAIYLAKVEENGFVSREMLVPVHLAQAIEDIEVSTTRHLLEYQQIQRKLKQQPDSEPEQSD